MLATGLVVWLLVLRRRGMMKPEENEPLGLPANTGASVDVARARELLDD
jgi:hypothetical protein